MSSRAGFEPAFFVCPSARREESTLSPMMNARCRGALAAFGASLVALIAATGLHAAEVAPRMLLLDVTAVGAEFVAVGERGTILRSTDAAHTWQAVISPTAATLTAVSFAGDAQHGWAVGHDALILATIDGGHSWQKQWQGENIADSFLDVLALDAQHVLATGAYGLFLSTADGGKTWARQKLFEEDFHLNHLTLGPSGSLYLAGEHGTLLRSLDHGAKWSRLAAPYDGSFYGVLPLDKRTLLAHGLRGRLYRSADDGATWATIATPQPVLLATALQLKSNFIVIAGQARGLLISRDYGHTFSAWPASLTTPVAKVIELPDGSVLAVGEAGATILPKP
jgi:photosystem II stability/assembly factor-like uncharacterized protein